MKTKHKRRLVVLVIILTGFGNWGLQGQVAKGTWMLRGNSHIYTNPNFTTASVALYTELGYMLSNRFMLEPSIYSSEMIFWQTKPEYNLNFGLGLRYYYGGKGKKIAPYVEAKLDSKLRSKFTEARSGRMLANTGADFFIHPNLAIEANVFYHWRQIFGEDHSNSWGGDLTIKTFLDKTPSQKKNLKQKQLLNPITKGTFMLGGIFGIEGEHFLSKNLLLNLQPRFALALNKHWIVGISPRFDFYYDDIRFFGVKDQINAYYNQFWAGGFVRYLVPSKPRRFVPFLELGYQWEVYLDAYEAIDPNFNSRVSFSKSHRWFGGVGADYFIHPRIALEGSLILDRDNSLPRQYQDNYLKFGVQAFLHKPDATAKKRKS